MVVALIAFFIDRYLVTVPNPAPLFVCIVALVMFQAGVAEIVRPSMERRLERPRWTWLNETINRFSMPLFLFHTTGMALHRAVKYAIAGERNEPTSPDLWWWLTRPFAIGGLVPEMIAHYPSSARFREHELFVALRDALHAVRAIPVVQWARSGGVWIVNVWDAA
mgnify:CR=1 FL=1